MSWLTSARWFTPRQRGTASVPIATASSFGVPTTLSPASAARPPPVWTPTPRIRGLTVQTRRRCGSAEAGGEHRVDERRTVRAQCIVELIGELVRGGCSGRRHAEALGDCGEVERRWLEVEHRLRAGTGRLGTDAVQLEVQDRVR